MKLKGILDFSLGNFLCLRGFAPMGELYDFSEPDESIQRDLLTDHRDEMVAFLRQGEFLFFPEVILSTTLCYDAETSESVEKLYQAVRGTGGFQSASFGDTYSAQRVAARGERRSVSALRTATLTTAKGFQHKFQRIDGNHRLSATPEDAKFRQHNTLFGRGFSY